MFIYCNKFFNLSVPASHPVFHENQAVIKGQLSDFEKTSKKLDKEASNWEKKIGPLVTGLKSLGDTEHFISTIESRLSALENAS